MVNYPTMSSSHAAFKAQTDCDTDYSLMYSKVKLHAKTMYCTKTTGKLCIDVSKTLDE